ncbi:hypothetical protein [Kitasatospora camelliae]|uniref:WD40 repeat protein n=1 Tax=Kitasatospora camelliae TaxID=3156397 RepID=A0AAU8JZZ2_9ACTN
MTGDGGRRIPALRAGRRPAGLALLGWLKDGMAPRLCRISGGPGAGKSHLLDWLAEGFSGKDAPADRRVHAVLPAAGVSTRGAAWALAHQLGLTARTPEDLVTAVDEEGRPVVLCVPRLDEAADPAALVAELLDPLLRSEHVRLIAEAAEGGPAATAFTAVPAPAVLDLDLPQWTDRARFEAWCATEQADPAQYPSPGRALGRPAADPRRPESAADLLRDVRLLAHADPLAVTTALDGRSGMVPTAWDAAGPALVATADPAVRAAVLRTRLFGFDEEAAELLGQLPAPWQGAWAMWPDSSRGWPGPVASLAVGSGPYAGQLLLADPGGVIRTVDTASGRPLARLPLAAEARPLRGLTVAHGGDAVLLDAGGALAPAAAEPGGPRGAMAALGGAGLGLSAVAAVADLPEDALAVGDETGAVHWYRSGERWSEELHQGPVTALAGTLSGGIPVLVSGGFDGSVRLWGPGANQPLELDRRGREISAVALADGALGMTVAAAWSDGLVRVHRSAAGRPLELRLGSPVWALGVAEDLLVLGTSDGVAAIRL